MALVSVRYRLVCAADDPQVAARVLGALAARSLVPSRFISETAAEAIRIDMEVRLDDTYGMDAAHFARVLHRIATVCSVDVTVDGVPAEY